MFGVRFLAFGCLMFGVWCWVLCCSVFGVRVRCLLLVVGCLVCVVRLLFDGYRVFFLFVDCLLFAFF